ncbi:MAG: DUF2797 domain-containing protein [Candidatus Bathyarchaeia archaeon]
MSPRLVSAVEWREDKGLYTCNLMLHDHGYTSLPLTPGSTLNFRIQPGRRCIGYHQHGGRVGPGGWGLLTPCPTSSLARGGPQCPSCQARDSATPCIRCRGEACTADNQVQEACLGSRAFVYLAAFGGRLKVGVTRENRFVTRWVEQGADAALRVLTGNGSEVRRFEHIISTRLGVPGSVRVSVKASAFGGEDNMKQALKLLVENRERVHEIFSSSQRFDEDPWVLAPHYNMPTVKQKPILLKVDDGLTVVGEVIGVKGQVLLLKGGEVLFVLGLSALLGRSIEFNSGGARSQVGLESFLKK